MTELYVAIYKEIKSHTHGELTPDQMEQMTVELEKQFYATIKSSVNNEVKLSACRKEGFL